MDCRLKWGNIARIRFWILLGLGLKVVVNFLQLRAPESASGAQKQTQTARAPDRGRQTASARPPAPDRGRQTAANPAFTYSYNVQFVSSDLVTLFTHPNRSTIPPRMTRPYLSAVSSCPSIAHGLSDEAYAAGGTW